MDTSDLNSQSDGFSECDSYERYIEPYSLPHCINLANMCKVNEAHHILEVGCSTGELSLFLMKTLTQECLITSIDISEERIARANSKKAKLEQSLKTSQVEQNFEVGEAQSLEQIKNSSIDVYLSPIVLHIVENPEKML